MILLYFFAVNISPSPTAAHVNTNAATTDIAKMRATVVIIFLFFIEIISYSGCPAPHALQNFATTGITSPQFLQFLVSSPDGGILLHLPQSSGIEGMRAPQLIQNRFVSSCFLPHLLQNSESIAIGAWQNMQNFFFSTARSTFFSSFFTFTFSFFFLLYKR